MCLHDVRYAVQIGCDIETSERAIVLARRFPGTFFATVGYHPETAQDVENISEEIEKMDRLVSENRDIIVAIGECGFDFHYLDGTDGGKKPIDLANLSERAKRQMENQKKWLLAEWNLAQKYDLPLVIHTRDARDMTLEFMRENQINRAVMHCFSEDLDFARELHDFSEGIYFSFSGIVTYKKSDSIREAAKNLPLDRILVETDSPFLAPQPVRGQVCEPSFTRMNLEMIQEIRAESPEEIENRIFENSCRFYGFDREKFSAV